MTQYTYTYARGVWSDGCPFAPMEDEDNFDNYMERIGYRPYGYTFGHEDAANFDVYESTRDGSFLALVAPFNGKVFDVYMPDFPSLMMFLRDFGSAFATDAIAIAKRESLTIMERQFQLQHGHSTTTVCPKCDPEEWEKRVEANRTRNAQQQE